MPGPATYSASTDRIVHTKPTLPTLGVANTILTDPTFGTRILRVSDVTTDGGVSIRSIGGAGNTLAWNADGTRFVVTNTGGGCILFNFNAATMQATKVGTLAFNSAVTFSLLDANLLYGFSSSYVEATITQYNCATAVYTTIVGVRTLVPTVDNGGRTYLRGVSTGVTSGVEYLTFIFGGTGQEYDKYCYWGPISNIAGGKTLDSIASTINGTAIPGGATVGTYLHAVHVEMNGRYVNLGPSTSVIGPFGGPPVPPSIIWDTSTDAIIILNGGGYGSNSDLAGGHAASGYGYICNFPDDSDGMESVRRSYASPHAHTNLISPFPTPASFYIDMHTSWSNANPVSLVPIIGSWHRYPTFTGGIWVPNNSVWREWDEEILGVSTDGSGVVYRFVHHRSDTNNDPDGDWFWDSPRPNVSPDGKWVLYTSNWERTLGTDAGLARQDVFIAELVAGSGAAAPSKPVYRRRAFAKDLTRYMSLGVSGLGTLLNGLAAFSGHAKIRYTTLSGGVNDNNILTAILNGLTSGLAFCVDGTVSKLRISARSVSTDTRQALTGTAVLSAGVDYYVGFAVDIAGKTLTLYVNGVAAGSATGLTFANAAWTLGTPTDSDAVGGYRAPPVATSDQWDGLIGDLTIWRSVLAASDFATLATGVDPSTVVAGSLAWNLPLRGTASPEVATTGGLNATLTGLLAVYPPIQRSRRRKR
jgi:hypothetical protein